MSENLSSKIQKFLKLAQRKTTLLIGRVLDFVRNSIGANLSNTEKGKLENSGRCDTAKNVEKIEKKSEIKTEADAPKRRDLTIPENYDEIVEMVTKTAVLSGVEKKRIAAILSFDEVLVGELMVPYGEIDFLHEDDLLGPIMLDKLYKSGFADFPVVDKTGRILGTLSTRLLNKLEIREETLVKEVELDKVLYVRNDYKIINFLATALRTRANYFIICDKFKRTVGVISLDLVLEWILWCDFEEEFNDDGNLDLVARRNLK